MPCHQPVTVTRTGELPTGGRSSTGILDGVADEQSLWWQKPLALPQSNRPNCLIDKRVVWIIQTTYLPEIPGPTLVIKEDLRLRPWLVRENKKLYASVIKFF